MGNISKSTLHSVPTLRTAIVLTVLSLLCSATSAFAQARDQKMDELVRKAETKEEADGFCAGTGWPPGDSIEDFTAFLRAAVAGSWNASTFSNGACVLNRVTDVHQENGGKCVGYTFYTCPKSGACGLGKSIDCLDRNGNFLSRRDG